MSQLEKINQGNNMLGFLFTGDDEELKGAEDLLQEINTGQINQVCWRWGSERSWNVTQVRCLGTRGKRKTDSYFLERKKTSSLIVKQRAKSIMVHQKLNRDRRYGTKHSTSSGSSRRYAFNMDKIEDLDELKVDFSLSKRFKIAAPDIIRVYTWAYGHTGQSNKNRERSWTHFITLYRFGRILEPGWGLQHSQVHGGKKILKLHALSTREFNESMNFYTCRISRMQRQMYQIHMDTWTKILILCKFDRFSINPKLEEMYVGTCGVGGLGLWWGGEGSPLIMSPGPLSEWKKSKGYPIQV